MDQQSAFGASARLARLFELIRQETQANTNLCLPHHQQHPSLVDMQRFLKRAQRSFLPEGSSQDD